MRFRVFGPVRMLAVDGERSLGPSKQVCLMACLLLHPRKVIPLDALVDRVWDGSPPRDAAGALATHASRLRHLVAPLEIHYLSGGYRFECDPELIDVHHVRRLIRSGRTAADPDDAVRLWTRALDCMAEPPLGGVQGSWAERTREELTREWVNLLIERMEAELRLGRYTDITTALARLCAAYPYDERLAAALMRALCAAGRPAEALDHYAGVRKRFAGELGADPGPLLRNLFDRVLRQDPELFLGTAAGPAAEPVAAPILEAVSPVQTPRGPYPLVGRQDELRLLAEGSGRLAVIVGIAGVGKTALALTWASLAAARYPGGRLYADLRGHSGAAPADPFEVMAGFVRAMGVAPGRVPASRPDLTGLYRSLTAKRRLLVVLDDAASAEQVRPLLPTGDGCGVVVTSRENLTGLVTRDGAQCVALKALPAGQSRRLLEALVGAAAVGADTAAFAALAGLCCHLPLALRIAAAHLAAHDHEHIREYVDRLRLGDRLAVLVTPGDGETAVRTAFEQSYQRLSEVERVLFLHAGTLPGADFDAETVGVVTGLPQATVQSGLDRLAESSLLERRPRYRFRFHDLIKEFAVGAAGPGLTDAVLPPLIAHYRQKADRLDLAWLDREHDNAIAAIVASQHTSSRREGQWLLDALFSYLSTGRHLVKWRTAAQMVLAHAGADDDHGRGFGHLGLAAIDIYRGRYEQGIAHARKASRNFQRAGLLRGKALALWYEALAHMDVGHADSAVEAFHEALALPYHGAGGMRNRARVLSGLGSLYYQLGQTALAADFLDRAAELQRILGAPRAQARTLYYLAATHYDTGHLGHARSLATQALQLGERHQRADIAMLARTVLADIAALTGDPDAAIRLGNEAYELASTMGDRYAQALASVSLATTERRHGHHEQAILWATAVVKTAEKIKGRYPIAAALIERSRALSATSLADAAQADAERALDHAQACQYRLLHGRALIAMAHASLAVSDLDDAKSRAGQALLLHQEHGHRLHVASARRLLRRIGAANA